jgi:uncharacterized protein
MPNTICHIELETTNIERAQGFYQGLFDWNFRSFTDSMVVFGVGDQHLGGLMKVDAVSVGRSPSIWIMVDDLDASVNKAVALGGSVLSPRSEVPTVGWSAQITDLDGNHVGMVEFEKKD